MNTVTSLMSRQTTLLDSLKTARAQLAAQETKVEQMRAAVAVQRKAAAENLVRKEGLEHSAAEARAAVATLVVRARAAEAAATRAHRADQRQLRVAKKQENRIRQLIIERSRRQHGGYSGSTGGFLFRPVPGYVTSPYGWREHPIYHYWGLHDGTDFHAPCGTPERAGRLRHGHLRGVVRRLRPPPLPRPRPGQRQEHDGRLQPRSRPTASAPAHHVRRGETVGYAGTTGWSTGCHLHFTVLLDGNPVDPMHYM